MLAIAAWSLNTQSGARSIARIAVSALGGKLALGTVDGTIAGPLTVTDLRYRDPEAGIDARLQRVHVDMVFRRAVPPARSRAQAASERHRRRVVRTDETAGRNRRSRSACNRRSTSSIDSFALDSARIRRDEALLVEITRAAFSGRWTSRDLTVKKLDVRSPQGEIEFAGRVREREIYSGDGHGSFRWTVGERSYAGVLDTRTQGSDATLALKLTAPLDLDLQAEVTQSSQWPWRFTLEAPRFDPREEVLPDSSLTSLAASLSGHGSAEQGAISGKIVINDEPLLIEPLRFMRKGESVSIDTILRISRETGGAIHIGGDVDLGRTPVIAKVAAKWHEVVVPVAWAGQELHTRGDLNLQGSSESYTARGTLSLGPPERIADVALNVKGTPQRVELEQFDISQQAGRLAARGRIDLQPQLAWDVTAVAKDFDPGAFAAAWRGKLGFDIASQGRMLEEGPEATLRLTQLRGELRGRPLSGNADLSLTPPLVASGTVALNSGESALRFRGRSSDQLDATVSLDVASLNDWIPNSGGNLQASFVVRGKWPEISIDGNASGRDLHAADIRVESLSAQADVDDPRNPQGSIRLDLVKLTAAGYQFDSCANRGERHSARRTASPCA